MANYRIFVPARKGSEMPDITINVEASNWLVALKESLKKIGSQGDNLSNILCETGEDGTMRVADPTTKRVFIIKEIEATAEESADDRLMREAEERSKRSREEAERADAARVEARNRLEEMKQQEEAAKAAEEAEAGLRTRQRQAAEEVFNAAQEEATALAQQAAEDATGTIGSIRIEEVQRAVREKKKKEKKDAAKDEWDDLDDWYDGDEETDSRENTLDEVLSDVFMATEDLYSQEPSEASSMVLDQAMKHVKAEAGSVFLIELNTALQDLMIASARGPIGQDIQGMKLPRGKGIVGFSALKAIKLTVNNVQRNPNFYGKLDKQFGFRTRSLLCIPVMHEERLFGVIEMVNKTSEEGEWSNYDRSVVESLANLLGKVLNYKANMVSLNI